jgi:gamma-glutamylcyclotransferase (GGCT)/AIG2-like uncharacterized protein YtfP
MLVAVYGTLRKGQANHFLMNTAKYVDTVNIDSMKMFAGAFFPFAVLSDKQYDSIVAELYQIDEETESYLDALEGVNHDNPDDGLYVKEQLNLNGYGETIVYVYTGDISGLQRIRDWNQYSEDL